MRIKKRFIGALFCILFLNTTFAMNNNQPARSFFCKCIGITIGVSVIAGIVGVISAEIMGATDDNTYNYPPYNALIYSRLARQNFEIFKYAMCAITNGNTTIICPQ